MAKVTPASHIADIRGALQRGDKVVYRVRDGVQQAYIVKHPNKTKPSDAQKQMRTSFKSLTHQVKAIYADSEQLAVWQAHFEAYVSTRQYKSQLNRYIREQQERSLNNPRSISFRLLTAPPSPSPPFTASSSPPSPKNWTDSLDEWDEPTNNVALYMK